MNWKHPNHYGVAVIAAIFLHIAVVGLFFIPWPEAEHEMPEPVPRHLVANVVQQENKAVKQRRKKFEAARRRKERDARRLAEKKKRQQAEKERQRKQKQQARKEAERKKKQAAQEKERLASEKARLEKQQALEEQQRLQQEKEMQEKLHREEELAEQEKQRKAAEDAQKVEALKTEYLALIRDQVAQSWRYSAARAEQEVVVRLSLVPTGQVIQVVIVEGSGNAALDRSVEQAVLRASPLPVPKDIQIFERNFRTFTMKFRPENATW